MRVSAPPGPFPRGGTNGLHPGERVAHQGQITTTGFSGISEDGMGELRLEIEVKRGIHSPIRAPMQEMPGTRMAFVGIKNDKDIADLWAYLKQFGADGAKK